jgi:hypothetical protein
MNEAAPTSSPASTTRPRRTPVADLFEETFHLYRGHFVAMVLVFAAFEIPIILAMLPLTTWQARWSQHLYNPSGADLQRALDELGPFLAVSGLFGLVAVVLGAFAAAGVTYVAGRARAGDRPGAREAVPVLRSLAPSILGYVGLILAAILLVGVGLVAIGLFGFGIGAGRGLSTLLVVVAIFAAIAVSIVGVARLTLVIPAMVLERLGPVEAVRRSWTLVEGSTLRTFGIVLLAGLVVTVIASIATPAYLPGLMEGILTGSVGSFVLVALVGGAVQTLLGPILPTLLTVLYFDYVAYRPEV